VVTGLTGQPDWSGVVAPGLGALAYGPVTDTVSGGNIELASVPLPPTARTLILCINTTPYLAECIFVTVRGKTSGFDYYNQPPYLSALTAFPFIIVPLSAVADSAVLVEMQFSTNGIPVTIAIYYDTLQFDESAFYNGPPLLANLNFTGTLFNGPGRLLTAQIATDVGAIGFIAVGGNQLLYNYSVAGTTSTQGLTLPQPFIIQYGESVTCTDNGVGSNQFNISTAYP
jgi:hypothetical protein